MLSRCDTCGHLHRDIEQAPARHREHAYGGEPALDTIRLALTFRALTRAWHRSARGARVFEVGFGSGALLRRFLDTGAHVAGTDPDQLEVDVDERVVAQGQLSRQPVENIDVEPDRPGNDLVYGIHVVEHVHDPGVTMARCAQLLAPGGTLQFLTPAGDSAGLQAYGAHWWMLEDPTHVRFFTSRSLARCAASADLVDIQVRRPVLDSLATDAASWARWLSRRRHRPKGVLGSRWVLVLALVTAPIVVIVRVLAPRTRPTLQLVARRPDDAR